MIDLSDRQKQAAAIPLQPPQPPQPPKRQPPQPPQPATPMASVLEEPVEAAAEDEENKHYDLGSHTMRRSFCTNTHNKNWSTKKIRLFSNHTNDKQLLDYIFADEKHSDSDFDISDL